MSNKSHSHYLITHKVLPKFFIALLITFAGMFIGASFIPASVAVFMPFVAIILLIFAFFAKGKRSKKRDMIILQVKSHYQLDLYTLLLSF